TLPQNRMVVGDVRADQKHDIRPLEILIRAGRAVAAERALVTGDGGGHTECGVAVEVAGAEPQLHELSERVELLGDELPRPDHANRIPAKCPLNLSKALGHRPDGGLPIDPLQTLATSPF